MNYSVIVPVFNEAESVSITYFAVKKVMQSLQTSHEILFVDDGSEDQTLEELTNLSHSENDLKIVRLASRSGKSSALQAGFDASRGNTIITMDGDLQDDPEDIPNLLIKLESGYDMVCGWRYARKDSPATKAMSFLANGIRRILTREKIHDVGCGLVVFKRKLLDHIHLVRGRHRFLAALAMRRGYRVTEIKVNHFPRKFGRSKSGFWGRLFQGSVDLFDFLFLDYVK